MDSIEQIIQQFQQRLLDAGTYAGANVERDRDWPLAPDDGAAFDWLTVKAASDRVIDTTAMRPRRLTIELEMQVRAVSRVAAADGNAAARARALALQVKLALLGAGSDITLGGIAKFMRYTGSDAVEDETNLDAAARDLTFIVTFQTKESSFEASA